MNTLPGIRFACVIVGCFYASLSPAPAAQEIISNHIVAVIEDEAITEFELIQHVNRAVKLIERQNRQVPDTRILTGQVLQQIIARQLQLQEARKLNVSVDEITLGQTIETMAENKNMSLDAFERSFRDNDEDYQVFRQNVRDEMTIRNLIQREVINQIQVSEKEIGNELMSLTGEEDTAEYRVAQIQVTPRSPEEAEIGKKRLLQIRKELRTRSFPSFDVFHKRFSRLWQEASTDDDAPPYRIKDLGWRYSKELPKPVSQRIDSLRTDSVSPIISSRGKLHLFQRLASRGNANVLMQRQYQVRHILIPTSLIDGDTAIKKRLVSIKRKLESGADFAKYACAYSHDPLSSTQGGNLGWSDLRGFASEFAEAAKRAYRSDTLVGPFKSSYGWHLVEVTDSREQNVADETLRQQAIATIRQRKSEENIRLWLLALRERSRIEIRI